MAAGLQTGSPSGAGYKLPPQSEPRPAPPGPEAQQRAAGLRSQRQGEFQAKSSTARPAAAARRLYIIKVDFINT